MEAAAVNAWFTPFHYFVYLGTLLVVLIGFLQWKWAKTCKENVLVLVQRTDGHGDFELAPQTEGGISLTDHKTNDVKTWRINELATVGVPYPGVGFVPLFLQKTIQMIVVSEEDWEPLTNRSPYRRNIASPNVLELLKGFRKGATKTQQQEIDEIVKNTSVAPTRELIADPSALGNLLRSSVLKALATVSKEVMDSLQSVTKKLNQLVNPTIVYIGLGLIMALLAFTIFQIIPIVAQVNEMTDELIKIKQALGVK